MRAALILGVSTAFGLFQPAAALDVTVRQGQSIQRAVDIASPGDRIRVLPGVYHEVGRPCPNAPNEICAVVVAKDNITLMAEASPPMQVVIENPGGQFNGVAIDVAGASPTDCLSGRAHRIKGFQVSGFVVRGFDGSGIFVSCAENFQITANVTADNKYYGIFPVLSTQGLVSANTASGAHDTGIYVGQSTFVDVERNVAHDNVSGFEIENSTNVTLENNESFSNTAGILMFIIPGDAVLVSSANRVRGNTVHDNNSPNTCLNPQDDVCLVPSGIGISDAGGSGNVIEHNVVKGNQTLGVSVEDVCTAFQIPPNACNLGFDPLPESTRVTFNVATGNGAAPAPGFPGADLFWTGNGTANCWLRNTAKTTIPNPLPECLTEASGL